MGAPKRARIVRPVADQKTLTDREKAVAHFKMQGPLRGRGRGGLHSGPQVLPARRNSAGQSLKTGQPVG